MSKFRLKDILKSNVLVYIALFFLYFALQLCFVNDPHYEIDEFDVFLGGKDIANGFLLYKEYSSQHMPLAYYISAIFDACGATSWQMQRICFYGFYSLGWVLIYHRNHKLVGRTTCVMFPLIFISAIQTYWMGTIILCEHIVAIGAVLLLLEFVRFYKNKRVDIISSIYISLAVILMFGSCFVAALGVAAIAVLYVIFSLYFAKKENREIKDYFKEVGTLFGIILLPWIIVAIIFAAQRNLYNAYYFSYKFNTTIYADYAYGEYSDAASTLKSMVVDFFPTYFGFIKDGFVNLTNGNMHVEELQQEAYALILQGLLSLFAFLHLIHRVVEKKLPLGIAELFFWMSLGMRGAFSYHSTYGVAIICLFVAMEIHDIGDLLWKKNRPIGAIVGGALFLCFFQGYLTKMDFDEAFPIQYEESTEIDALKAATEDGEAIGLTYIFNHIPMMADRPVYPNVGGSAWHWEACKDEWLETPVEDLPRVVIFQQDYALPAWDQTQSEYAPELIELIEKEYTLYPSYSNLFYIRNDYYDEASKIMDAVINQ